MDVLKTLVFTIVVILTGLMLGHCVAVNAEGASVPTTVIVIACRVDDLTGQPGRHDPAMAAQGWRDLELRVTNGELSCKREQIDLEDAVALSPQASSDLLPLHPDFGDWAQCARVGVVQAQAWDAAHKGWATVAVGCPTPIVNGDGKVIAYKLPECPSKLPGTDSPIRCRFDASVI